MREGMTQVSMWRCQQGFHPMQCMFGNPQQSFSKGSSENQTGLGGMGFPCEREQAVLNVNKKVPLRQPALPAVPSQPGCVQNWFLAPNSTWRPQGRSRTQELKMVPLPIHSTPHMGITQCMASCELLQHQALTHPCPESRA